MVPHFSKIKISNSEVFDLNIDNWIRSKLKGRYYILNNPAIDETNKVKLSTFVGFEDQKELTYFMLACPFLRRN